MHVELAGFPRQWGLWHNISFTFISLKKIFIWLCRVLVATLGIFDIPCDMWDLLVFLLGKFHGQSKLWWATVHGVTKSRTQLCD